jgi:hypothetical protein
LPFSIRFKNPAVALGDSSFGSWLRKSTQVIVLADDHSQLFDEVA